MLSCPGLQHQFLSVHLVSLFIYSLLYNLFYCVQKLYNYPTHPQAMSPGCCPTVFYIVFHTLTLRPSHQGAAPAVLHHPNNGIDVLQHYLHRVLVLCSAGDVDGPHLSNRVTYYNSTSLKIMRRERGWTTSAKLLQFIHSYFNYYDIVNNYYNSFIPTLIITIILS